MISISSLKKKALLNLKNNWLNPIVISLLVGVLSSAIISALSGLLLLFPVIIGFLSSFFIDNNIAIVLSQIIHYILSFSATLLLLPLTLGYIIYFLMFVKRQKPEILNLFDGYKKCLGNSILAGFLTNVYIFLWSLLLIIPGIIKSLSYAMTYYIIADNPNIKALDAIKRSQKMMNGHKWEYFVLELSFIGWVILSLLTCGIGFIWLTPYMETTKANFYLTIKEDFEEEIEENIILEEF